MDVLSNKQKVCEKAALTLIKMMLVVMDGDRLWRCYHKSNFINNMLPFIEGILP